MTKPDEFERTVAIGLRRAENLGHEMQVAINDGKTTATYTCTTCGLGFNVGFVENRLQLVAETACTTRCGVVGKPESE